jgi:hypothetical protein
MENRQKVSERLKIYIDDDIPNVIEELQKLHNQGYEYLEKDRDLYDDYESIYAVRTRLETDEEFQKRVDAHKQTVENRRRLYESLKKEFGD